MPKMTEYRDFNATMGEEVSEILDECMLKIVYKEPFDSSVHMRALASGVLGHASSARKRTIMRRASGLPDEKAVKPLFGLACDLQKIATIDHSLIDQVRNAINEAVSCGAFSCAFHILPQFRDEFAHLLEKHGYACAYECP